MIIPFKQIFIQFLVSKYGNIHQQILHGEKIQVRYQLTNQPVASSSILGIMDVMTSQKKSISEKVYSRAKTSPIDEELVYAFISESLDSIQIYKNGSSRHSCFNDDKLKQMLTKWNQALANPNNPKMRQEGNWPIYIKQILELVYHSNYPFLQQCFQVEVSQRQSEISQQYQRQDVEHKSYQNNKQDKYFEQQYQQLFMTYYGENEIQAIHYQILSSQESINQQRQKLKGESVEKEKKQQQIVDMQTQNESMQNFQINSIQDTYQEQQQKLIPSQSNKQSESIKHIQHKNEESRSNYQSSSLIAAISSPLLISEVPLTETPSLCLQILQRPYLIATYETNKYNSMEQPKRRDLHQ